MYVIFHEINQPFWIPGIPIWNPQILRFFLWFFRFSHGFPMVFKLPGQPGHMNCHVALPDHGGNRDSAGPVGTIERDPAGTLGDG